VQHTPENPPVVAAAVGVDFVLQVVMEPFPTRHHFHHQRPIAASGSMRSLVVVFSA